MRSGDLAGQAFGLKRVWGGLLPLYVLPTTSVLFSLPSSVTIMIVCCTTNFISTEMAVLGNVLLNNLRSGVMSWGVLVEIQFWPFLILPNVKRNEGGFLRDVCLPEIVSLPLEGPSVRVALKMKMNVEHGWSDRRTHKRNLVKHLGSAAVSQTTLHLPCKDQPVNVV
jgi:hypothetical protein